jgi:DNA-binding FrmR family transcriptional regulator
MSHVLRDRQKLLNRIRRIRGQLDSVESALLDEKSCAEILQRTAVCRGAMHSLLVEVMESHMREHVFEGQRRGRSADARASKDLGRILRTYLR